MREVIVTGKTVEEATIKGCEELGLSREDVSVEILEMPVNKLFKKIPAKVKVSAIFEEETLIEEEPVVIETIKETETIKAEPVAVVQSNIVETKQEAKKKPDIEDGPTIPFTIEANTPVAAAAEYLTDIFAAIGAPNVAILAFKQGNSTLLRVEGEEIADVIDVNGDMVQALSFLVDRAINKGVDKKDDNYLRVRLDVAGYRNRREVELQALAKRTAEEVLRTKRSRTLAPMNAYERLIVHTAIGQYEELVSESIGADLERRVVIKSTAPDATDGDDWKPSRRGNGNNKRRRNNNDRRRRPGNSGQRKENTSSAPEREFADKKQDDTTAPIVPAQREAIKDGDNLPLYGKIEL